VISKFHTKICLLVCYLCNSLILCAYYIIIATEKCVAQLHRFNSFQHTCPSYQWGSYGCLNLYSCHLYCFQVSFNLLYLNLLCCLLNLLQHACPSTSEYQCGSCGVMMAEFVFLSSILFSGFWLSWPDDEKKCFRV
jgi:hypothetical protein